MGVPIPCDEGEGRVFDVYCQITLVYVSVRDMIFLSFFVCVVMEIMFLASIMSSVIKQKCL